MSKLTINDFPPLDPPVVGHAAFTAMDQIPAPHRNSWRAAQDEIARAASELARLRAEKEVDRALIAAQDARLAKAGADLEECKKLASGLITDIGAEKEARAVAERIARERAAEVQRLEARVRELEPLAEVGRRIREFNEDALAALIRRVDGNHALGAGALAAIIHTHVRRAAGIGEEVQHG
jgi:chromosome segregation ATPase